MAEISYIKFEEIQPPPMFSEEEVSKLLASYTSNREELAASHLIFRENASTSSLSL